ncbi:MAG: right-handed parallel beta-helix repeat-containing protein [Verrucomicrobia bacterium]|nr:right-handed parallel beta-helix repeat-containing protein [Verrucomicrobiota bacterium]
MRVHLVTPAPGSKTVIDVFNLHDNCIEVTANYVVVRGLELKNAGQHAVLIRKGVQNVVVEDCRITGWGRVGGARVWGVFHGSDSAVYGESGSGGIVIQGNLIEHPRSGSNDWESGHPDGPQSISLVNSSGGNIIRYNTIRSTEDHGYNDGIGGASNFSFEGSPNRDSDIYGNIVANCWDDAIESEGANMNVRIWSNYLDKTFVFVATASTSKGPIYIFRNLFGTSRVSHQDASGGMIIKTAGPRRFLTLNGEQVPGDQGRRVERVQRSRARECHLAEQYLPGSRACLSLGEKRRSAERPARRPDERLPRRRICQVDVRALRAARMVLDADGANDQVGPSRVLAKRKEFRDYGPRR